MMNFSAVFHLYRRGNFIDGRKERKQLTYLKSHYGDKLYCITMGIKFIAFLHIDVNLTTIQ
jgi:hypothetical protein